MSDEVCPICQVSFGECEEVLYACTNKHAFHPHCLSCWFQTKALNRATVLTCPNCRNPTPGWRTVSVIKSVTTIFNVAVKADFDVFQLKKQLEWIASIPVCTMNIAVVVSAFPGAADILVLENQEPLPRDKWDFHVVLRATNAEYTLLYDLPRCKRADNRFKCPISRGLLLDPVVGSNGHKFDRTAIQMWIAQNGNSSPRSKMPVLPLAELDDPVFAAEVAAIQPDAVDPPLPPDTAITLRVHIPRNNGVLSLTVRSGDIVGDLARRVLPAARRIVTEDGCMISAALHVTLSQCKFRDGDLLYVSI